MADVLCVTGPGAETDSTLVKGGCRAYQPRDSPTHPDLGFTRELLQNDGLLPAVGFSFSDQPGEGPGLPRGFC